MRARINLTTFVSALMVLGMFLFISNTLSATENPLHHFEISTPNSPVIGEKADISITSHDAEGAQIDAGIKLLTVHLTSFTGNRELTAEMIKGKTDLSVPVSDRLTIVQVSEKDGSSDVVNSAVIHAVWRAQ